ncbi:MAG: enoyl-CoA hydratase/isomerase family protein [Acidobacteria bacterium]|nr:enoyl-CoA hydratase/isomerase family protein [Acidobacteriota bacterium]
MALTLRNLLYEVTSGVARVIINRPPMNILDQATIQEMQQVLDSIAEDPAIDIIVFSGAGPRAFSAGVEIRDHLPEAAPATLPGFHRLFLTLMDLERTTIAAVHGFCLGGGCELALFCDWVIATANAQFGQPEIKVGAFPPVAAVWLPKLIGYRRALELICDGQSISAQEARDIGMISEIVANDHLDAAVAATVARLRERSPLVLRLARRAMQIGQPSFRESLLQSEKLYLDQLLRTEDAVEGLTAFLEKRPPVWKGR